VRAADLRDDAETARVIAALGDLDVGKVPGRKPKPRSGVVRNEAGAGIDRHHRHVQGHPAPGPNHHPGFAESFRAAQRGGGAVCFRGAWPVQLGQPAGNRALSPPSFRLRSRRLVPQPPGSPGQCLPNDFGNLRHLVNPHERVHLGQQFGQFIAKPLRETTRHNQPLPPVLGRPDFRRFENRVHTFLLRGINEGAGVDDDGVGRCRVIGDLDARLEQIAEHQLGIHEVLGAAEGYQPDAKG